MYNILVCDDDKEIVEAIEIYLTQEGYHVLKAYDGVEALKVLEEQEAVIKQEITYSREKKKHPGRAKLPDHLPVEEIEIHPEGDLSDKVCIGKETTDVLDYVCDL